MIWIALDRHFTPDMLGYIPGFLSEADPRPAAEQLDENYAHGGGWHPQPQWKLNPETLVLQYPGDPPIRPLAFSLLRRERIVFYPHELLMILQPNGEFEVCRMN